MPRDEDPEGLALSGEGKADQLVVGKRRGRSGCIHARRVVTSAQKVTKDDAQTPREFIPDASPFSDTSAGLLLRGGTAFRAARKRKRFRYEESANRRRHFKTWDAPVHSAPLKTITSGWFTAERVPVCGSIATAATVPRNPATVAAGTVVRLGNTAFSPDTNSSV